MEIGINISEKKKSKKAKVFFFFLIENEKQYRENLKREKICQIIGNRGRKIIENITLRKIDFRGLILGKRKKNYCQNKVESKFKKMKIEVLIC